MSVIVEPAEAADLPALLVLYRFLNPDDPPAAGECRVELPDVAADRLALGYVEGWRGPVLVALESGPGGTVRRCHPQDPSWANWPVRGTRYGGYQVPETAGSIRVVSPAFIRHAHGAGLEVQVWTVDDEDDMERLAKAAPVFA